MIEATAVAVLFLAAGALTHCIVWMGPEAVMGLWRARQARLEKIRRRKWLHARYAIIEAEIARMRQCSRNS